MFTYAHIRVHSRATGGLLPPPTRPRPHLHSLLWWVCIFMGSPVCFQGGGRGGGWSCWRCSTGQMEGEREVRGTEPGAALSLPLPEPGLPSGQVEPMQEGTVGGQTHPASAPLHN